MKITEYVLPLGSGARKRHRHMTEKGKVQGFAVQLEVRIEGVWRPVIRYDCTHGFAHIDCYNIKGEKRRDILNIPFEEALTIADEDIKENWEKYKDRFLSGGSA